MQRNNYSEVSKNFSSEFFSSDGKKSDDDQARGPRLKAARRSLVVFLFCSSDFVVDDSRCLSPILGLVDLEIREECRALTLQKLEHRHCAAANLQLGAFARSQLQHRPPG